MKPRTLHLGGRRRHAGGPGPARQAATDRSNQLRRRAGQEPDLTGAGKVRQFFGRFRPDIVIVASGLSGGIGQNQNCPADLMEHNLLTTAHLLGAACRHGVGKLLYLGSSCMYPREAAQPLAPASLHTGALEPTSAAYATAKLAGLLLCQSYRQQYGAPFISAIPANAFGPHDDFHADSGHVIPSLMGRMHQARLRSDPELVIWGTGRPRGIHLRVRPGRCLSPCAGSLQRRRAHQPGQRRRLVHCRYRRDPRRCRRLCRRIRFDADQARWGAAKCLDSSRLPRWAGSQNLLACRAHEKPTPGSWPMRTPSKKSRFPGRNACPSRCIGRSIACAVSRKKSPASIPATASRARAPVHRSRSGFRRRVRGTGTRRCRLRQLSRSRPVLGQGRQYATTLAELYGKKAGCSARQGRLRCTSSTRKPASWAPRPSWERPLPMLSASLRVQGFERAPAIVAELFWRRRHR